MLLIVSTSLNPVSKSRRLAEIARESALCRGLEVDLIDLQVFPLPLCDGAAAYSHPNVALIQEKVKKAHAVIIAAPIYNFTVGASCKNFIELLGNELKGKVASIMTSSGSIVSYLAPSSLILSLLLDLRCHIVPQIVMADASSFDNEGALTNPEMKERIGKLVEATHLLSHKLS